MRQAAAGDPVGVLDEEVRRSVSVGFGPSELASNDLAVSETENEMLRGSSHYLERSLVLILERRLVSVATYENKFG